MRIPVSTRWRRWAPAASVWLALIASPFGVMAAPCEPEPVDQYHALEIQLNEFYRAVDVALAVAPVEQFDVSARQALIGDDPDALFAWVRDHTRLLPYQGALRGAPGTLLDRSGSHLDRALLLAALLESANYEVRLARATLDEMAVARLPAAATDLPAESGHGDAADSLPPVLASQLGADPQDLLARIRASEAEAQEFARQVADKVAVQSQALAAHIEDIEAAPDDLDAWYAALADHWWVQVRRGRSWQDLDPSLAEHAAGDRLAASAIETFWPEELPAEVQHRLTIEVVAERLENRRLREATALKHEVAVIDLPAKAFPIELHPMGMPDAAEVSAGVSQAGLWRNLAEETEWIPFLIIDGESINDKVIGADGSVSPLGLRSAQADAMEEASGLLGQLGRGTGARGASPELTAVFLRLTVATPGRDSETFERALMDVLGPDRRSRRSVGAVDFNDSLRETRALAMFSSTEMLVQRNWWPAEYAMGHLLHDVGLNRQAVLGAIHSARRNDPELLGQAVERIAMAPAELVQLAFARSALSPHPDAVALTRINLLSTFENITESEHGPVLTRGFDIIENRVDVIGASGAAARRIRLDQGVADTVLEAELLAAKGEVVNTSLDYGRALAAGRPWTMVDRRIDEVQGLKPDTAVHVGNALASGKRAILPVDLEAGSPLTWWRVDPATGSTLGLGPAGRGQSMTEAILIEWKAINAAYSAVKFTLSVWECLLGDRPPSVMQCCIVHNFSKFLVNWSLGQLYSMQLKILGMMPDSPIYQLAVTEAIGKVSGAGVDTLAPGC